MNPCGACGAPNADDAQFCSRCGSALGATCPSCGAGVAAGARFCSTCGSAIEDAASAVEELKLVTVLFADVKGSTALGEQLDPERLRDVLRTYFDAMREEIEAEGGTVEKFIGDAIMAAFGVPAAHEDDPARALRAARRMLDRLGGVNEQLLREHGITLEIRIGVNTGGVLATADPRPGEPMVTGDAVNAAARLQSAAEPGEIIASERTLRAVRGFRVQDVGALQLRGKAERVRAFRILGETELGSGRRTSGLAAPLVGRDAELRLLLSLFERVRSERRPHLITLFGDAGVGKSRLTREFLDRVEARGAQVYHGRCLPYGEGVTFWPLAEILKAHAGVLDSDPPDIALERISKAGRDLLTPEVAPDPARATAALAFTVGVHDPAFAFAEMDPKVVRAEVHAAWRSFFSALGSQDVAVVLIEDIHWADQALLDLLEDLAERTVGAVLFLCPARPELTARRPAWGGGRRNHTSVAIDPLTRDDAERLVALLLAIDLPEAARLRVLERAEGNPFFLEEILRHMIDEGVVVREDGGWRAAPGVEDVEIPDTVQGVLAARVDLLEPSHKRVLQAAAVVGRVFWPGPVAELSGSIDVTAAIDALESRDLVLSRLGTAFAGEPEYLFKHILTRDVAYESLPKRERASAHASVAAWIERTAGARTREQVELLAYHYSTAVSQWPGADDGLRTKAFEYLVKASEESRSKQVLSKAERLGEDALALARTDEERATALEVLGFAFHADYNGDPAWRYLRDAARARAGMNPIDHRRVSYLVARACEVPIRWPGSMRNPPDEDEVQGLYDIGVANLPEGDSEERARLLAHRAGWGFSFPRPTPDEDEMRAMESDGLEAAEMALRLDLPDVASGAFDAAVGPTVGAGRYGHAMTIWMRRRPLIDRIRDTFELGDLIASGAWFHYELGRYEDCRRQSEEGLARLAGLGANAEVHTRAWHVATLERLGKWDAALEEYRRMQDLLRDRRDDPPYFVTHAVASVGMIHEWRGQHRESDRIRDMLVPLSGRKSARLHPGLTRLLVERGEVDRAGEYFARRPDGWRVHAAKHFEAACELVAAAGAWDEVAATVVAAQAQAAVGAGSLPAFIHRLRGRAAVAGGQQEASAHLAAAVSAFTELETPFEAAVTRTEQAGALLAGGHAKEALTELDAADETFERLGATKALQSTAALRARASATLAGDG